MMISDQLTMKLVNFAANSQMIIKTV